MKKQTKIRENFFNPDAMELVGVSARIKKDQVELIKKKKINLSAFLRVCLDLYAAGELKLGGEK